MLQTAIRILYVQLFLISSDKMRALCNMSCNINNATNSWFVASKLIDLYCQNKWNSRMLRKMTSQYRNMWYQNLVVLLCNVMILYIILHCLANGWGLEEHIILEHHWFCHFILWERKGPSQSWDVGRSTSVLSHYIKMRKHISTLTPGIVPPIWYAFQCYGMKFCWSQIHFDSMLTRMRCVYCRYHLDEWWQWWQNGQQKSHDHNLHAKARHAILRRQELSIADIKLQ